MTQRESSGTQRDPSPAAPGAPSLVKAATVAPAVAAVSIGALYTIGILVWSAQLRDAGVTVTDALPLIPLSQLLARGIDAAVGLTPSLIIILIVAVGMVLAELRSRARATANGPNVTSPLGLWLPSASSRIETAPVPRLIRLLLRQRRLFVRLVPWLGRHRRTLLFVALWPFTLFLVVWVAVGAGLFLVTAVRFPWFVTLLSVVTTPVILWQAGKAAKTGFPLRPLLVMLGVILAVVVGISVLYSVIRPPPLPMVTVDHTTGPRTQGRLISQTEQVTVVATTRRRIVVIPARGVRRVTATSRTRPLPRSVFALVTGHRCLTLVIELCPAPSLNSF